MPFLSVFAARLMLQTFQWSNLRLRSLGIEPAVAGLVARLPFNAPAKGYVTVWMPALPFDAPDT